MKKCKKQNIDKTKPPAVRLPSHIRGLYLFLAISIIILLARIVYLKETASTFSYSDQDREFSAYLNSISDSSETCEATASHINRRQIKQIKTAPDSLKKKTINLTVEKKNININTASLSELILLPGIGKTIAARIIAYRHLNGKFQTTAQLTRVKGIGKNKLDKIKNQIMIK